MHDKTLDTLTLAIHTNKIFQSRVSSTSAVNHMSYTPILGEENVVHTVCAPAAPHPHASRSPTPSPRNHCSSFAPTASWHFNSLFLFRYYLGHGELVQKFRSPCSWLVNLLPSRRMLFPFLLVLHGLLLSTSRTCSSTVDSWWTLFSYSSGSQIKLLTTECSSLTCWGLRLIPQHFGSRWFDWPFQLAPVSFPILRAAFLRHHVLLLNVANQRVFSPGSPCSPQINLVSSQSSPCLCAALLSTFKFSLQRVSLHQHQICNHFHTCPGPLVFNKPCLFRS